MEIHNFYYKNTVLLWSGLIFSALVILLLFIFFGSGVDAKVDTPTNRATVNQSTFRAYNSSTTATPGSPLAAGNTAVTLPGIGDPFRVRAGLTNTDQPYVPLTIKQVASASYYTCALTSDDWVYCWSNNTDGNLGIGRSSEGISAPTAIINGDIPAGATIKSISASSSGRFVCVVASNDWVYCWGDNNKGQLGDNTTTPRNKPTAVSRGAIPSGETIKSVATGWDHSCAIASNNRAYCWGNNDYGELGDNTKTSRNTPVVVVNGAMPSPYTVKAISAGDVTSCVIGTNDKAYCWGLNWDGRFGAGSNTDSSSPVAMVRGAMPSNFTIKDISVGVSAVCVIANDDKGYCAGSNDGQLGSSPTTNTNTMRAIDQGQMPGLSIKKIVIAQTHGCAVASDDWLYCWGVNGDGQLGNNSTTNSRTPVNVAAGDMSSGQSISSISLGSITSCASTNDGKAYCWGNNNDGNIGDGTQTGRRVPTRVLEGAMSHGIDTSSENSIAYGISAACTVASDDWVYCWGWPSQYMQTGNNTTNSSPYPTKLLQGAIPSGTTIKDVSMNDHFFTCALGSNNWMYCWGNNANGQLGNNTGSSLEGAPVAVVRGAIPSGENIAQMETGGNYTCALSSGSWVYCWGYGGDGSIGNGSNSSRSTPTKISNGAIPSGATIKKLSVGNYKACVIASDDWLYCWGYSSSSEPLGDGGTSNRNTPVKISRGDIPNGVTIKDVTVGDMHICAIGSDDNTYCWGNNASGQLGIGSTSTKPTPAKVSYSNLPSGVYLKKLGKNRFDHNCAIGSDNWAYCWGAGSNGRLGTGTSSNSTRPVAIIRGDMPESSTVLSVATGERNTCLIDSHHVVYCTGYNDADYELGNGSELWSSVPAKVSTGAYNPDKTISSGALSLKLQFAPKASASTCSAVSSGWADVTSSSAIAFGPSPPANSTAITSSPNDPVAPTAGGFAYQSIVRSGSSFSNNTSISPQQTGLWDFSLVDRTGTSDTSYCLRMVPTDSTNSIDAYDYYPEIKTAPGSLDVAFVDGSGTELTGTARNVTFPSLNVSPQLQTSTSKLVDISSKQLDIYNSLSSGSWTATLAASGSSWLDSSTSNSYQYNGSQANGQLSVGFDYATMEGVGTSGNGDACNTTGLTLPTGTSSYSGSVSSITLLSASSSSQFGCHWRLKNVFLDQTIPQYQPPGEYKLDMTVTVVAQ